MTLVIAYKLLLGYMQCCDFMHHARYWPTLSDMGFHTSMTASHTFWTKPHTLEQDLSWYFGIGRNEPIRDAPPANVFIKLFGLILYMICVGKTVPYQHDADNIRATCRDILNQWNDNQVAIKTSPKCLVKLPRHV